jgi:hypothetical protein
MCGFYLSRKISLLFIALTAFLDAAKADGPYPPDLDLSQATSSIITKVAEYDARLFHINFDTPSTKVPDTDVLGYAEGRAIKHDLTDSGKRASYTSAFFSVLKQLRIDGE